MILRSLIKLLSWVSRANWHCGQCWVWVPAAHPWKDWLGDKLPAASGCPDPHLSCDLAIGHMPSHLQRPGCSAAISSSNVCKLIAGGHGLSGNFGSHMLRTKPFAVKTWVWFPRASRWAMVNTWDISKEVSTGYLFSYPKQTSSSPLWMKHVPVVYLSFFSPQTNFLPHLCEEVSSKSHWNDGATNLQNCFLTFLHILIASFNCS